MKLFSKNTPSQHFVFLDTTSAAHCDWFATAW